MDSIGFECARLPGAAASVHHRRRHYELPCSLTHGVFIPRQLQSPDRLSGCRLHLAVSASASGTVNSSPRRNSVYRVGDFMTRKEYLHAVKSTTTVDEAIEILVNKRITGFPVIDDDWKLVGVVSDYDLLALDSVSAFEGGTQADANLFPDVNSSWKTFREIQRLLSKTHGKFVGDLMTPAPLVVHETTILEEAVRLLLETKYHRLPVVDSEGRLVGTITRGNVVRAARQIKRANEMLR